MNMARFHRFLIRVRRNLLRVRLDEKPSKELDKALYTNQDTLWRGPNATFSKFKRGLSGFANGSRISAFPDTGSTQNVVSEAFVRELKLEVKGSPCEFKLGNSQQTKSIGELLLVLVKVDWWLTDSSRHCELQLGIFRMRYRCYEHRLRCPTYMQL